MVETNAPKGDHTAPRTWSDYYASEVTLPRIHDHLRNMAGFMAQCQTHFPGKRILEIGTGTGIVCVYFSQLGYEVTGLDADSGIVARNHGLNRRFQGRARFLVGDMFHLPFAANTFDACYHQGLLEHFDPDRIVDALRIQTQVCRRVVFAVPTALWQGGVMGDERLWPGREWRRLLEEFRVLHVFGGAYGTLFSRGVHFAGQRLAGGRPRGLLRRLAVSRAGEIGFVIEKA